MQVPVDLFERLLRIFRQGRIVVAKEIPFFQIVALGYILPRVIVLNVILDAAGRTKASSTGLAGRSIQSGRIGIQHLLKSDMAVNFTYVLTHLNATDTREIDHRHI